MARRARTRTDSEDRDNLGALLARYRELKSLGALRPRWDGYEAEPPAPRALENAEVILETLSGLGMVPERITPSAEGGVAVVLSAAPIYAAIECFNDGDVVASLSDRADRHEAWETGLGPEEVRATVERLVAPLHA